MSRTVEYHVGQELPDITFTWRDTNGTLIDFSSGWTFTITIDFGTVYTQTTNITGAATDPNVTWAVPSGSFDSQSTGPYAAQIKARRSSDSKDRIEDFTFVLKRTVS